MKELEDRGIGRPSTYASVIETILRRDYVFKKGSALVPTWTAFAKVQLLERYFSHLIDYEFTATMEEALDAIARGEGEAEKWLHSFYFGNGQVGLRDLVAEEHLAQIDKAEVNAVHIGVDGDGRELVVRVWPNGANIERGDEKGPVPADLAPDELTPEKADELLARAHRPPRAGHRSRDRPHRARAHRSLRSVRAAGRAGAAAPRRSRSGRRCSRSMDPAAVTLEQALALLSLPRVVGVDDDGEEITAQNGRYGPYLKKGNDSRSLGSEDELFSVTMERGEGDLRPTEAAARPARRSLRSPSSGAHPESGVPIRVLDGRFGPYITDGTINASVPRGTDPETVSARAGGRAAARAGRACPGQEAGTGQAGGEEDDQEGNQAEPRRRSPRPRARSRSGLPRRPPRRRPRPPPTRSATKPPAPGT